MSIRSAVVLALAIAPTAAAGFTGWSTSFVDRPDGARTYQVFATFTPGAAYSVVQCSAYQPVSGTLGAWHSAGAPELNPWDPAGTSASDAAQGDSFVTITGSIGGGTGISIGDGDGSSLPSGSAWYALAGAPPVNTLRVMQITRSAAAVNSGDFAFSLRIGYTNPGTTAIVFAQGNATLVGVPAPGALALLGFAACHTRRRRRTQTL